MSIINTKNIAKLALAGYMICEGINMFKYYVTKSYVDKYYHQPKVNKTLRLTVANKLIDNILMYDKDPKRFVENLFYNKIPFEQIPKNYLIKVLGGLIFAKNQLSIMETIIIYRFIEMMETKTNTKFKNNYNINLPHIKFGDNQIITWYQPFGVIMMKLFVRKLFNAYLHKLGFKRHNLDNGFVVWIRVDDNIKYNPLILFHCSIGGCIPYSGMIHKIMEGRILILPEIPGVSWENYVHEPPTLNYMADMLHDKINDLKLIKYDVMCHSFGWALCTKYFYKYHSEINKIVCVEASVILNHALNVYSEFYDVTCGLNSPDKLGKLCIPFLHRDVYLQFYFQKDLSIYDSILIDREEEIGKDIHLILVDKDDKIPTAYYDYYIKKKNLPYKVKIFNNRYHASFVYDMEIQNYMLTIINTVNHS